MKAIQILLIFLISNTVSYSQQDVLPPNLIGLSISPQTVDVSSSSQTVTIAMELTDDISGVSTVSPTITFPNGNSFGSGATLSSGTNLNGIWTLSITIPQGSFPGTAYVFSIFTVDVVGNFITYSFSSLVNLGFDPDFEILNTSQQDILPPNLIGLSISPQTVDVSSSSQTVTITMELTDDISGVSTVSPTIIFPNGNSFGSGATLSSGTNLNGIWTLSITIPQGSYPGTAYVFSIITMDVVGNSITYSFSSLINLGFDPDFEILNTSQQDILPPNLIGLSISPQTVDVSSSSQTVTITMELTDNISGVSSVIPTIAFPNGNSFGSGATLSSGTNLNGIWTLTITIPQGSYPGTAYLFSIFTIDVVGNFITYPFSSLINLGFDPDFEIVNTLPLPITYSDPLKVRPVNKTTYLTWSVSAQINNDKYIIEHSLNGIDFSPIGDIKGDGNTTVEQHYTFIHKTPSLGVNFYRIRQVDYDGQYVYSNITSAAFTPDVHSISIYPNPVVSELTITANEEEEGCINDMYGKMVKKVLLNAGKTQVDLSELPTGIYIFSTNSGKALKILKQ